ncbi:hypothetical protein ACIHFE_09065 [Streptomyces sp. NPDC052396]|uniref:hypothetical protein n=1 Tax=Streptomyces sp. NPDC052396 TaxID=3365689 RepID=UPI0037CD6F27
MGAAIEATRKIWYGSRRQAPDAQEEWTAFTQALRSASPERYPNLAAATDDLFTGTPGERRI